MKWIVYSLSIMAIGGGLLVGSSTASSTHQERQPPEAEDEDFIPTEKVPADSAISFPVDI